MQNCEAFGQPLSIRVPERLEQNSDNDSRQSLRWDKHPTLQGISRQVGKFETFEV